MWELKIQFLTCSVKRSILIILLSKWNSAYIFLILQVSYRLAQSVDLIFHTQAGELSLVYLLKEGHQSLGWYTGHNLQAKCISELSKRGDEILFMWNSFCFMWSKDFFHKTLEQDYKGDNLQLYHARAVTGRNGWKNFHNDSPRYRQIMTAVASLQLMHCVCKVVGRYFGKGSQGPFPTHILWGVSQH